ncbi:MAG: hypothetical protein KJ737_07135 [Proteobacteria bacterium]|nr:hypothetical protein [Pseudomonadota bacterium]
MNTKNDQKASEAKDLARTPPRSIRLKTLADLRRFLARVVNQLHGGQIEEGTARTFAYILSIMKEIIKDSDLEQRLEAVERALKIQKEANN